MGAEIEPHTLVKVMGTSASAMMIASFSDIGDKLVQGICGQVDGSIVFNMLGLEAGQSAFGDLLAWFKNVLIWPIYQSALISDDLKVKMQATLIADLSKAAAKIPLKSTAIVALDWVNGRRTPDANQALKGVIMGLNTDS